MTILLHCSHLSIVRKCITGLSAYAKIIFNTVTYNRLINSNVQYKENKRNNNKEIRSSKHITMAAK